MKKRIYLCCLFFVLFSNMNLKAQNPFAHSRQMPFKVTIFAETIGLTNLSRFFKKSGVGIKAGTEFYYSNGSRQQFFQTLNVGVYRHKNYASAFFLSSEVGYRHFFGRVFADATLGGGVQFSNTDLPTYRPSGEGYDKTSGRLIRFMPVIGLGTGYHFNKSAVFARYELMGEMPFRYKGIPVLPHQSFNLGTQFRF
ncbi:MAG: hypothetical protein K2P88_14715 [Chitinophagaceae bacterium]|uniref:hypothetical protein n=1 Tax=unclassified Paraflavitalea TaxID=2798305 RepID=UPI003D35848A|nr:hypothetical protein [Chitinophagaceae bacterium]